MTTPRTECGPETSRVEYGRFQRLKPRIHRLYVDLRLPRALIAERLGLPPHSLGVRLNEWGFPEERDARDREVANEALADFPGETQ